uniref:Uncharacterized protein n=1 Tax=Rhizophagus irregularis (strain DAOM 181602 / DAOM 197198 / MUCL 43194) TaxID=747089 RepID=U9UD61_RHIID
MQYTLDDKNSRDIEEIYEIKQIFGHQNGLIYRNEPPRTCILTYFSSVDGASNLIY